MSVRVWHVSKKRGPNYIPIVLVPPQVNILQSGTGAVQGPPDLIWFDDLSRFFDLILIFISI